MFFDLCFMWIIRICSDTNVRAKSLNCKKHVWRQQLLWLIS